MTDDDLRERVAEAVLGDLGDALEHEPEAYLKLVGAADVAAREADRLLHESVAGARRAGLSWDAIGGVLGVSRQAAQQRFRLTADEPEGRGIVRGMHPFNELDVLAREGRAGNHMVSFGPFFGVFEPSDHQWEHERLAMPNRGTRSRMEREGWQSIGSWFPYRYYKRALEAAPVDSAA